MKLPVGLENELRLALAQQLERGTKPAFRPKSTLGDYALYAVLASGQPHDLGRLAVSQGGDHDGRCGNQGHTAECSRTGQPTYRSCRSIPLLRQGRAQVVPVRRI